MPSTTKKKVSTAADFKKKALRAGAELELPSGQVVVVKTPGLPQLLADGVVPDSLTPIIMKAMGDGDGTNVQSANQDAIEAMGGGMVALTRMMDVTSMITAHCIVEPRVLFHKRESQQQGDSAPGAEPVMEVIPDDERDPEIVYTDEIEDMDKSFIFQVVVGGTRDLAKFREATSALVGIPAG